MASLFCTRTAQLFVIGCAVLFAGVSAPAQQKSATGPAADKTAKPAVAAESDTPPSANTNSATGKPASGKTEATDKDVAQTDAAGLPEFVRVFTKDNKPQALQTAVVTYRKPGEKDGATVTLIGAVHIGERAYYQQLNKMFSTFDALLYELVADPEMGVPDPEERGVSPISTIQVGLKDSLELSFQLDEVDYKAKNFVHADMTPQEFFTMMESRKEGVLQMLFRSMGAGLAMQTSGKSSDIDLLAALVSKDRAKALRRAFAEQMSVMDGQMAALTGEDGKSTLITERNAKAFEVLDREIKAGKKKLGIFYGAGHLKDMHQRLIDDFGMQPVETKWLNAWELQ